MQAGGSRAGSLRSASKRCRGPKPGREKNSSRGGRSCALRAWTTFPFWLHTRDCGHRRRKGTEEYARKERKQRKDNHISPGEQILILEVQVEDA
jgi:hypothetical protein